MSEYLNLHGLDRVATKVNQKLKTVTTMPASATLNDVVLYKGVTTSNYKQGGVYVYKNTGVYYAWTDLTNTYYTKSATPSVGDAVYSNTTGTLSAYTVESYDTTEDQVTINNLVYDRKTSGDTNINEWVGTDLILGETNSTAYRGDRGKTAYDHATEVNKISAATPSGFYKVASTTEGHIASLTAVTKSDITELGIPDDNTEYDVTINSIGSASDWNAGSITNVTVNNDSLDITLGAIPTLTVTPTSVVTAVTEKT